MYPDTPAETPGGGARLLLGNEAIAQGLFEAGCRVATAYPGTPSTEILEALAAYGAADLHVEWSVNEKVALEVAVAGSYSGLRTATIMKQVGLNVASDPLMSLAYTGVAGGLLIVVADDPGPHSSQTEQDTRALAMAAGVPVLDPMTPEESREMVDLGFRLSEKYGIPVILRPVLRVCHSRAAIQAPGSRPEPGTAGFRKDPDRWAATPKHRYVLHGKLNEKIRAIASDPLSLRTYRYPVHDSGMPSSAIVASGVPAAYAADVIRRRGLADRLRLISVGLPFPLNPERVCSMLGEVETTLILEETGPVMETVLAGCLNISGRLDGTIPSEGEMTPDLVDFAIRNLVGVSRTSIEARGAKDYFHRSEREGVGSPPTLCAGCSHRSSFWALKKAMPGGIYTGDIGCYTLGIALGAVDTVLCMGASISQASGFFWAYGQSDDSKPAIAAVIGDSTFYHSGIPALVNAVQQGAAFVVLVLDNGTTAMTGGQPTPGTGTLACGENGKQVPLEGIIAGCGVSKLWITDPMDYNGLVGDIRAAADAAACGEMAVVICRSPCVLRIDGRQGGVPVIDPDVCNGCRVCTDRFGCPAIVWGPKGPIIIADRCPGCGVCLHVCSPGAIRPEAGG